MKFYKLVVLLIVGLILLVGCVKVDVTPQVSSTPPTVIACACSCPCLPLNPCDTGTKVIEKIVERTVVVEKNTTVVEQGSKTHINIHPNIHPKIDIKVNQHNKNKK